MSLVIRQLLSSDSANFCLHCWITVTHLGNYTLFTFVEFYLFLYNHLVSLFNSEHLTQYS